MCNRGDLDGSEQLQREELKAVTHTLGPEHPDTLTSKNKLATTLRARGDLDGAEQLQRGLVEAQTRALVP